jgi:bacillithiol biosynthesis deacetylase BshB1
MINILNKISEVDILAIGVHPDDIELSCVGTVLKHLELGYKVGYCDLTQGEMGTRGSAELRMIESEAAAKLADVSFRVNLKMEDAFFQIDKDNISKIAEVIRLSRPKIILANAISDRHPDHGRASKLISDASFYSGLARFEIGDTAAHRPDVVYHYIQDRNIRPDFYVDISSHIEKKFETIFCFSSQFFVAEDDGPKTPISSKSFMEYMRAKNKSYGRDINSDYAEGFTAERTIGIKNLFDLI